MLYALNMQTADASQPWQVFLKLALLYPVLEEIVFRGGLQTILLERTPLKIKRFGVSGANVVTSLVFAAAHLINQPALWAILVFIPSIIFGWVRERYDSVLPSIVLHAVYNAGFVWLFVRL